MTPSATETIARQAAPEPLSSLLRIGYLIGRFPNACHTYFWREVSALRRMGADVAFVSTQRPDQLPPHEWAAEAAEQTTYLCPIRAGNAISAAWRLLWAGSRAWSRVWASIRRADVSAKGKLKLAGYALLGARRAQIARTEGWTHIHSGFCNDAANVALFARLIAGLPYSISLHDALDTFGPNQREKWRHASFGTVITQRLRRELIEVVGEQNLPPRLEIAPNARCPLPPTPHKSPLWALSCGVGSFWVSPTPSNSPSTRDASFEIAPAAQRKFSSAFGVSEVVQIGQLTA